MQVRSSFSRRRAALGREREGAGVFQHQEAQHFAVIFILRQRDLADGGAGQGFTQVGADFNRGFAVIVAGVGGTCQTTWSGLLWRCRHRVVALGSGRPAQRNHAVFSARLAAASMRFVSDNSLLALAGGLTCLAVFLW
jgi:hypothetical protein